MLSTVCLVTAVAQADFRSVGFRAQAVVDGQARQPDGLFAERLSTDRRKPPGPSTAWAAGVQLSALNAAAKLDPVWITRAHAYAVALDRYRGKSKKGLVAYQPFPGFNGGDLYYDDNAWLVMAFLDTAALNGDRGHVRRAIDAYKFLMSGETDELGGGIFWRADEHTGKHTCSNAPGAVAAMELYRVTKEPHYLADAKRLRDWTHATLQDADGLFFDAIKLDKTIERTKWSYNSALMIRANGLLFEATGEQRYLDEAKRIAAAAEAKWFRPSDGALMDEASFAHLLVEALLYLDRLAPDEARVAKVDRALAHLQTLGRNGVYPKRWDGWMANEKSTELLTQASAVRAFLFVAHTKASATPATRPQ